MYLTILFAILAFFIGYKIFTILGSSEYDIDITEEDRKTLDAIKEDILKKAQDAEKKLSMNAAIKEESKYSTEIQKVFQAIRAFQKDFTAHDFIVGASNAFSMIIGAFSKNDQNTLKNLVDNKQLERFSQIHEGLKNNRQEKVQNVISVIKCDIIDARINNDTAFIEFDMESEQISWIQDSSNGTILSGSKTAIINCKDRLTFYKKIQTPSNIWLLTSNA